MHYGRLDRRRVRRQSCRPLVKGVGIRERTELFQRARQVVASVGVARSSVPCEAQVMNGISGCRLAVERFAQLSQHEGVRRIDRATPRAVRLLP